MGDGELDHIPLCPSWLFAATSFLINDISTKRILGTIYHLRFLLLSKANFYLIVQLEYWQQVYVLLEYLNDYYSEVM